MKKLILSVMLVGIMSLSACGITENDSVSNPTESATDAVTTEATTTESITEATANSDVSVSADVGIAKQTIEMVSGQTMEGMLYDFDFDGIPELIQYEVFIDGDSPLVYKYVDNEWQFYGKMYADFEIDAQLCFDKTNKKNYYFFHYYSHGIKDTDETNEPVFTTNGYFTRHSFEDEQLQQEIVHDFRYESNGEETEDVYLVKAEAAKSAYLLECDEILSRYENVKAISIRPLWTGEDIRSGAYKDIIREYFRENPVD